MSKWCIQVEWDDVPHLTEKDKAELRSEIPLHQLEAREKGIPVLGSGVIYPIAERLITCEPFAIPDHWPRAYALDVGWNRTAALWGAWDRDSDVIYLYSEYYRGREVASIHADAIKARGSWIWGAIDPASAGASQLDGRAVRTEYESMGLNLVPADNMVEAGIHAVFRRLQSGRLQVFKTLHNWLTEFRAYRRDDNGKVVKKNDHLMDATKYLILTGMRYAECPPSETDKSNLRDIELARNSITGY